MTNVITNTKLYSLLLVVNRPYGLLICNHDDCKSVLNYSQVINHLKKQHLKTVSEYDLKEAILTCAGLVDRDLTQPLSNTELESIYNAGTRVDGIPVKENCFQCTVDGCGLLYSSFESLKNHSKSSHPDNQNGLGYNSKLFIQTLFKKPRMRYFQVRMGESSFSSLYKSWFSNTAIQTDPELKDMQITDTWLSTILTKIEWTDVVLLKEKKDFFPLIQQKVTDYIHQTFQVKDYFNCRVIIAQIFQATTGKEFSKLQELKSLNLYAKTVTELACHIINAYDLGLFGLGEDFGIARQRLSVEITIENVNDLLDLVILEILDNNKSRECFRVAEFLVVQSMDDDDGTCDLSFTTQRISHLMYYTKLRVYELMKHEADPTSILRSIKHDQNNAYHAIRSYKTYILNNASLFDVSTCFNWIPKDGIPDNTRLLFENKIFDMALLHGSILKASATLDKLLEDMSSGYKLIDFDLGKIHDNFRGTSKGYYFLKDALNSRLLSETENYFLWMEAQDNVMEWIKSYELFIDTLLYVYHVSAGQPARKTGISELRLFNDGDRIRSVFFRYPHFMIVQWYSKNHGDPIIRFLPQELSSVLLKFFVYMQPWRM
jgi:hypothetical protein